MDKSDACQLPDLKAIGRAATGQRRQKTSVAKQLLKDAMECPLRCCRAPEMACGSMLKALRQQMILGCG